LDYEFGCIEKNDWAILTGILTVLIILLFGNFDPVLMSDWTANGVILLWKYRDKL
jgi:hypothetical protein